MEILDENKIREEIKKGHRRDTIRRAEFHQYRIRFHAQTRLTAYMNQPTTDFLAFVKNILPHDKYKTFLSMFRWPVKTNEITSVCFDKLSRIFDGRDPVYSYQFTAPEYAADWEEYRTTKLNEPQVWSTKGWEFFKTDINSVLICDLPEEQSGDRPEPYFYWLPIGSVITYKADRDTGVMKYIVFHQHDKRIAVIDEASYRIYKEDKNGNLGELERESSHDLGYCPARFFWSEPLSLEDPDVKASPLTKQLDSLDWFLFYHLSKRQLDLSGAYPIYSGYEQQCDYSNAENGDYCDGGYLRNKQGYYLYDASGLLLRCPKCGDKRTIGPGSFVEIPIPDGEKQPDLRNPVQMLTVDRNALDYNVDEERRLRSEIITAVVGQAEQITQREALNEQQIIANFESQTTVLNRVKRGFEAAQKFVDETCCRLRYGAEFVSCTINYGTRFFLATASQLREEYKAAKEAGASETDLDAMQRQIIETEYHNDPQQMRRMLLLFELEPFHHLTTDEALTLNERGVISPAELRMKLDFPSLVRRFERENMNVLDFGSALTYDKKINTIKQTLLNYATDQN
jgi:hypothetical protein